MREVDKESIENFVKANSRPYDPETDSYEKLPYDKAVTAGKNTPIYNAHSYHTKVPYQGIIPFIEHYTEPGDLILDPFCGTGMTGVASLLAPGGPRKVILNDLSPAAVHIARNYCTPCDVQKLKKEFERIKEAVKEEFDWLYGTYHEDPKTGEKIPATIQYVIWSDIYRCQPKKRDTKKHPNNPDGCGAEIVLWDVAVDHETGDVLEKFSCPYCKEIWRKTELSLLRSVPVITNYVYIDPKTKKKRRAEHQVTDFEIQRLQEIDGKEILYWYPTPHFDVTREMWRGVHRDAGITKASDFYTKRNLFALAKLWDESKKLKYRIQLAMQFLITSVNINISRMWKYKADRKGGSVSGTLYVPSLSIEQNVLGVMTRKLKNVCEALSLGRIDNVKTAVGSATDLLIPDSSVDYIFTDPPFGANIFYSDCSFLWEAWLGEFTDDSKEAVWNKSRTPAEGGKTLEDYKRLMSESFNEMYRVLKPNRWATVVFSNSDDLVWEAIQDAAHQAGFIIYGGKEFDKVQRSFKGVKGEKGKEKVISKDVLLNLHKPLTPIVRSSELTKIDDVEGFVLQQVKEHLQYLPPEAPSSERTIEAITRAVQRRVLEKGCSMQGFSASYVSDVLHEARRKFALVEQDGAWHPANGYLKNLVVRNEASAILWLTGLLSKNPIRFDEIDPPWKQEKHKGRYKGNRGLQDILEDFFIKSPDGTYRVPDDHERHALRGQAENRDLRECERYLEGKLNREPQVEEKFAWIKMLSERKLWSKILELERTLTAHPDWQKLPDGKFTQDRIRLAKTMIKQKPETAAPTEQTSMF